jgi:DNA (cytosine-5)-methyltransferase 1
MCLNAGAMGRLDAESETLIPVNRCDFDEDRAFAFRTSGNCGAWETGDKVDTLTTGSDPNSHVIAFPSKDHGADATVDLSPTLRSMGHDASHANGGGQVAIAEPYTLAIRGRGDTHRLEYRQDGTANAVLTPNGGRAGIGVGAVAYAINSHAGAADGEQTNTSHASGGPVGLGIQENCAYTLRADRTQAVATRWAVRRLTPRECERLQGFPDDFTAIARGSKSAAECPDGPRYKAMGNSMAVPVMAWIGARMDAQIKLIKKQEGTAP